MLIKLSTCDLSINVLHADRSIAMTGVVHGSEANCARTPSACAGLESYNQQLVGQVHYENENNIDVQKLLEAFHQKASASHDAEENEPVQVCCEDDIFFIEKLGSGAEATVRF